MNNPILPIAVILLLVSFLTTINGMIKNSAVWVGGGLIITNIVLILLLLARFLR